MRNLETGCLILDRSTSDVWRVVVLERHYGHDEEGEYEYVAVEAEDNAGKFFYTTDLTMDSEGDFTVLEPLQVLELAKQVTEQALSASGNTQQKLCKKAIWLLQWFCEGDDD